MKDNKTIEEIMEEFDEKFGVVELDTGAHPLYVRKLKQFLRQALQQYGESVREEERGKIKDTVHWLANHNDANDVMFALEDWDKALSIKKDNQ